MSETKEEAYYTALDNRVESHLDYVVTDYEILGKILISLMEDDSCTKILVKNIIRDKVRNDVFEDLNLT